MPTIIKYGQVQRIDRGGGISTVPLITGRSAGPRNKIVTGISAYPKGEGAPLHSHNTDEQVTLLSGAGEVEIDGVVTPLQPYDSTYIEADRLHAFRNTGDDPMVILWIYTGTRVTRTFADTGETVEHLSDADLMSAPAAS